MKNNFKKDFLWGSASAAYQIEGAYDQDGKGPSIWDQWVTLEGKTYQGTNGNIAADFYHRYQEDIALMKEMGLKAYRFSISWPRLLPKGKGEVNPQGIAFYRQVLTELHRNGITPLVTLYHWDLPLALQEAYGGWLSPDILDDFTAYAKLCFESFGDLVKHWIILNEPNIFTQLGYQMAMHPPGLTDTKLFLKAYHHTAMAHAKTVLLFKEGGYPGVIGSSIAYTPGYAASTDPKDLEAKDNYYATVNWWLSDIYYKGDYPAQGEALYRSMGLWEGLEPKDREITMKAAKLVDFIGINYYQSATLAANPLDGVGLNKFNTTGIKGTSSETGVPGLYKMVKNPSLETTDWDWVIDPQGLTVSLVELTQRYHKPILISENGLGAVDQLIDGKVDDHYRIDYFRKHIDACAKAIEAGVDLMGYCTWSFTDLLSWLNGYHKRYGFVYVDFADGSLRRIKKASFDYYKDLIRSMTEDHDR